jgi:predicted RNA binding protein YcfA (HicA-like mRNA interferase family)
LGQSESLVVSSLAFELAIGTLRGILKQAGVRAEEFIEQL